MEWPLVSVIVPVFNGERYLDAALSSVLAQDYRPYELIVVDDGSDDSTAAIARSREGVRYLRQPNNGVAAARNAGIAAAVGEFLAFIDHDDTWSPQKLRVQMGYLLAHPEIGFVLARMRVYLEPGTPCPPWLKPEFLSEDQAGAVPSALLVRRSVFEQVGEFNAAYRIGEDTDWFARAKDAEIRMVILPEVLLQRRIHAANLSHQRATGDALILRALRASLERQRRKSASTREGME